MTTETHTQAGLRALAGAARLRVVAGSCPAAAAAASSATHTGIGVYGHHQSASWTVDAIAKPNTFMVLTGKNRPTRQTSELSP